LVRRISQKGKEAMERRSSEAGYNAGGVFAANM
jgi:hypothetical protein